MSSGEPLRIRPVRHAREHDAGSAVEQRAIDLVGVGGNPADIGGISENIALVPVKNIAPTGPGVNQLAADRAKDLQDEQRIFGADLALLQRGKAVGVLQADVFDVGLLETS